MKIIISPAKKMNVDTDSLEYTDLPVFMNETQQIMGWMQKLTYDEAKKLWSCNDKIAELNFSRFREMELKRNLTPALLSYEGIQYQYMAPGVFTDQEWNYVQEHLRILSGFYGVVKPLDGVTPYRLEMQAKAKVGATKDLYDFWGDKLYEEILDSDRIILNLASKEYSKCIENYLHPEDKFVTCVFGEWKKDVVPSKDSEEARKQIIQKGTQAKMARGEMVRFMAENKIESLEEIKQFNRRGYMFKKEFSSEKEYVFVKE
ncbi:MAG: peroxide stress protein YaaA [Eubacterium sp.]